MKLKYFGKVEDLDEESYEESTVIDGYKVDVCLDLEEGLPDGDWFKDCKSFLDNLEDYNTSILEKLKTDTYSEDPEMDTVGYLVEEWLENLDDATVLQVAGVSRDDDNVSKEMLKKLHLEGVAIYDDFVEWNYVIDDLRAGAFLSVITDFEGEITEDVSIEH